MKNRAAMLLAAFLLTSLAWSAWAWFACGSVEETCSRSLYRLALSWPIVTALVIVPLHRLTDLILPEAAWWKRDLVCFAWLLAGHVFWP